ncbi:MAG: alpha/beta hydrolase [Anaerolineales bacterium]|nr:alpha/beta hydrolase [Anaerolineales bacterium]
MSVSPRTPPAHKTYFVDLPLSRLHVLETGEGAPLIMVPATISEWEDWLTLAQFMAQWFKVYFFELPGHGQSTPFSEKFSSHHVAELVEQLTNKLGLERFNLMGFSFGGILAMRAFQRLSHRIDRLVLIAPCLGKSALPYSDSRLRMINRVVRQFERPKLQSGFVKFVRNPHTISLAVSAVQKIGRLERTIPLKHKLPRISVSTISVLTAQINEILTTEFDVEPQKYDTPCYFAMSIYDPLLRFDTTLGIAENHFGNLNTVRLTFPFHQPPRPFTFEELNDGFYKTVDSFMRVNA